MDEQSSDAGVILDDHRKCMSAVAEVEDCLLQPMDREGKWTGRLVDSLTQLAVTLRSHFETEEQEPLFVTMPSARPRFAEQLVRLKSEHASMIKSLDSVIEKARAIGGDRIYEQREINGQVQMLVAAIRRHEAEENEILIQVHWDEVGVGD